MSKMNEVKAKFKTPNVRPTRAVHSPNNTDRAARAVAPLYNVKVQRPAPQPARVPDPAPAVNFTIHHITSVDEAHEVVQTAFTGDAIIGIDIETMKSQRFINHPQAGLEPHLSAIRLVQLCQSPDAVYVFDVTETGMAPLLPLFSRPLVAHNAVFEMSHLYHAGIDVPQMDCTLLMQNALKGGRISLKELAREVLDMEVSKQEQDSDWSASELSQNQIRYAAMDAWLVYKMAPMMLDRLKEQDKEQVYALVKDAQFPVMKMQYNGCHFDGVTHYGLIAQIKQALKEAEARLQQAVGPNVKISSNKQLSDHYKKVLDSKTLKEWKRTEKGDELCLDKDTVKRYSYLPVVQPLAEYKRLAKLTQSFGDNLLGHVNPATGRIHSKYIIAGAVTGRFISSEPNLQQIPNAKEFRQLFSAPAGRKIVVADYSQVELRILAMQANEPVMLEVYRRGEDLHRMTASIMAGVPPENVTAEQRRAAKPVNFGIIFGMGDEGLSSYAWSTFGVSMTPQQAKSNINAFFKRYPMVKRWGDASYKNAKKYKYAETRLGRTMPVQKAYTQSRNYPVQGSAGEVMLAALIELDKEIAASGLDIKLVNNIHDEIVLEVAEADAEPARALLERAMVNGMLRVFPEAHTTGLVEAHIADNWGDAK